MAYYDKNTCHEFISKVFFCLFLSTKNLVPFTTVIYACLFITFVHDIFMYIHIVYINTHVQHGLKPKPHEDALRS
jgi:hypothetical protein